MARSRGGDPAAEVARSDVAAAEDGGDLPIAEPVAVLEDRGHAERSGGCDDQLQGDHRRPVGDRPRTTTPRQTRHDPLGATSRGAADAVHRLHLRHEGAPQRVARRLRLVIRTSPRFRGCRVGSAGYASAVDQPTVAASDAPARPNAASRSVGVVKHLTVTRIVDAPVARVWQLLTHLEEWPRWGPSIRSAELDDPAVGLAKDATGSVTTVGGLRLHFVITEYTDRRSWAWSMAGVPATDHLVEDVGGACRVHFGVPAIAAPYLAICAMALRRIERIATSEA